MKRHTDSIGKQAMEEVKKSAKNLCKAGKTLITNPKVAALALLTSAATMESCGDKEESIPEPRVNTDAPSWSGEFSKIFSQDSIGQSIEFRVQDSDGIAELTSFRNIVCQQGEHLVPVFDEYFDLTETKDAMGITRKLTLKSFDFFDDKLHTILN